jgi:NADPH:quinone reductase
MIPTRTLILKTPCEFGIPDETNFSIVDSTIDSSTLPSKGGLLLRALYFSADPYLRSHIRSGRPSSISPGSPIRGFIAGKVEESTMSEWKKGDLFGGSLPFSTVQIVTSEIMKTTAFWKLTEYVTEEKLSLGVGVLGMPGATAFGGLIDILRPVKGETLLVTAASGAVGQLVGQLAKSKGCRVIGTAGGLEKCKILTEKFNFDAAIDHKSASTPAQLEALIRAVAPEGLNMVFENVGTTTFECAFKCLSNGGRIAVCGAIAAYNEKQDAIPLCSIDPMQMIYTNQRIEGFVCSPWLVGKRGGMEWLTVLSDGVKSGEIKITETIYDRIEKWPQAFADLFTGTNNGKVVIRV